jgi:hypothetical protein
MLCRREVIRTRRSVNACTAPESMKLELGVFLERLFVGEADCARKLHESPQRNINSLSFTSALLLILEVLL